MQTLVVAEKPSVARDIARVLGAGAKGEGCLTGGGYVVTWALGHLVTLTEPQELDARHTKWNAGDLPIHPQRMETKVIKKTRSQFLVVKKLMNDAQTEFSNLLGQVNQVLRFIITGQVDDGGCGGNCSSCGGSCGTHEHDEACDCCHDHE